MTRDDIQKLLGGYATGTLTPEEQQALFAAALDDQELFNSLAKEQALRDLLRDPAARAHVLAAIDERAEPWWRRPARWIPRLAAAGALAACLAAFAGYAIWHARQTAGPVLVAGNHQAPGAPVPSAVAAPVAQAAPPEKQRAPAMPVRDTPRRAKGTSASAPATAPTTEDTKQPAAPAPATRTQASLEQKQADQSAPAQSQGQASQQSASPSQQQTVTIAAAAPVVQMPPAPATPLPLLEPRNATSIGSLGFSRFSAQEVKWSTLRRESDGSLAPLDPDQIRAGDDIVLRLAPYADGQLSVAERAPGSTTPRVVMADTHVEREKTLDTPDVTLDHPGVQELLVRFVAQTAAATGGGGKAMRGATAKASAAPPPVTQTIRLRYQ